LEGAQSPAGKILKTNEISSDQVQPGTPFGCGNGSDAEAVEQQGQTAQSPVDFPFVDQAPVGSRRIDSQDA